MVGEQNVLNLEVGRRFLAIRDCDEAIDYLAAAQTEVHERTAKLALALFGGATADPELDRYLTDFIVGINQQTQRILGVSRDRGWLREDVPFDELVETVTVIGGVETYLRITDRDGWTASRYKAWIRRIYAETVFR